MIEPSCGVGGIDDWHSWHEAGHWHELLLAHWVLNITSRGGCCDSWHGGGAWNHTWSGHVWHHWEATHSSHSCVWILSIWRLNRLWCCSGGGRSASLSHDLLLHGELLSEHGLVLLEHLLVHDHLLVEQLVLLHHNVLTWLGWSAVSVLLTGGWLAHHLRETDHLWHHSWGAHHTSEVWVLSGIRILSSWELSALLLLLGSSLSSGGGCFLILLLLGESLLFGLSLLLLLCLELLSSCEFLILLPLLSFSLLFGLNPLLLLRLFLPLLSLESFLLNSFPLFLLSLLILVCS